MCSRLWRCIIEQGNTIESLHSSSHFRRKNYFINISKLHFEYAALTKEARKKGKTTNKFQKKSTNMVPQLKILFYQMNLIQMTSYFMCDKRFGFIQIT
ncbi:hypothetical protein BpHYR1_040594 [Brachionus plicatilis]|uniref:Uncharacterized protein n=1 Tax=Brachionus plicatilis TaxID=10195 RepID=A0A3M7RI61_BRAPC|nr:hypothetical protein BpHYR1_040594 [Brachionus plicatilis]